MSNQSTDRAAHEIEHGRYLADHNPESIWGWSSPAGTVRARRRAQLIVDGAALAARSRVLEVGCGTGLFTGFFESSGATITAVDISPELIERAKRRGLGPRVTFESKRFEDCAADGPFDAVIGNSILHHLDLREVWPNIYELLKPGGRLSFAEPNLLNPQIWAERTFRGFFPQVSEDETAFVRRRVMRELVAAGFIEVRVEPFDWLHPAVPARLIGAVRQIGQLLERLPVVREFAGSLIIQARRPGGKP